MHHPLLTYALGALTLIAACTNAETLGRSAATAPASPQYQAIGTLDGTNWSAHSAKALLYADSLVLEIDHATQPARIVIIQYSGAGGYAFANDDSGQGIAYATFQLAPQGNPDYATDGNCYLTQVDTLQGFLSATVQAQFVEATAQGPIEHQLLLALSRIPLQNSRQSMNHSSGE